jgi:signal transduction histidine kinase
MRIKTQFIITVLLIVFILLVISGLVVITNREAGETREQEKLVENIAQEAAALSYLSSDYLIYQESQQVTGWQSRFNSFSSDINRLNVDQPEQQAIVRSLQANQRRLKAVFDSTVGSVEGSSPNQRTARVVDLAFFQVSWSRLAVQTQGLVSDATRLSQLFRRQTDQLMNTRTVLIYIMVSIFGLFLIAAYMLTYRRILKSIATLQAGTNIIGSGNLDFTIKEERNDEIGELSRAFNQMTSNLKNVTASKEELASIASFPMLNPQPIVEADLEGQVVFLNPSAQRMFPDLLQQSKSHPWLADWKSLVHASQENMEYISAREVLIGEKCFHQTMHYLPEVGRIRIYGTDITYRKKLENELKKSRDEMEIRVQERTAELTDSKTQLQYLASQLLTAQENERKRIALEVHDILGSSLSAIKFKVEEALLNASNGKATGVAQSLKAVITVIQDTIAEARRIQSDLRPPLLDDLGIIATFSWFCRRFQTIYSNIRVKQEITIEEDDVPEYLKIGLFRITQEAMNNIAKYSRADLVRLGLKKVNGTIALTVQDNGEGFDLESLSVRDSSKKGLGIPSMKERTELLGGSFTIESAKGKGTVITAVWPA